MADTQQHDASPSAASAAPAPAFSNLDRTGSTGTWGETSRGEAVDVDRARADFEQARHSSRQRQQQQRDAEASGSGGFAGGSRMSQILSGSSRRGAAAERIAEEGQTAQGPEHLDAKQHLQAADGDFDLGAWILSRQAQAQRDGVDNDKPLGVSWRNVEVSAPAGAGGGVFVKTLPHAIANTAWRDPLAVVSKFIPPVGRLLGGSSGTKKLIHSHSGVLRAGQMALVIGRPGSGCSTLLKALTTSSDGNLTVDGTISFAGLSPAEIESNYRGEVIFSDEDDQHFPTLTVAQTLEFALSQKVPRKRARLAGETRADFIQTAVDVVLKMFNMSHVRSTIVGDAAVRGVSGGERKRVTLSEALITRATVQAFDNATRGLDASTALEYARSLRIITDLSRRTTFATLYQVSESIFQLFDVVSVVDEGRCIYYGPRDRARSYFEELGYYAPERQTTADFCTALVDPGQVQFREGFEKRAPRTAEERERAWLQSDLYKQLEQEIAEYDEACRDRAPPEKLAQVTASEKNKHVRATTPYTVSFWRQVQACMWRQLLIRWGARQDMYVKLFTIVAIGLVIGALFYGQPTNSTGAFSRGGALLLATLFNGWLQLSEGYEAVAGRPMLARHQTFAFHRQSAVTIARAIIDIPLLLIQTLLFSIIFYFMASLRVDAGAFFYFELVVLLSALNLTYLYRAIAAFSPTFHEAIRYSVCALNVLIIASGYVVPRTKMNWLIWLSYSNGISFAFTALLVNEFNYPIECAPQQVVPFSNIVDSQYQTCTLKGSTPGQLFVPSEAYLEASFGYSRSSMPWDWAVILAFTLLYLGITVFAAEKMNWAGSGGGVTVFARNASAKRQLADSQAPETAADDVEAKAAGDVSAPRSDDSTRANSLVEKKPSHGSANFDDRAVFTWKDVNLTLASGRELLHKTTGYCKPGRMTALMGASGAGKTTLMTALSQRGVAGSLTGDILIDGKALDRGFHKGTGLVLQGDVHLGTQTVREAIEFSALLRQAKDTPREEKLRHAQHCIDILELGPLADALIGVPGAGLGVEKRKRVTIGVELAAKPDLLLFLDEPTSGLDSAGAASIIRLLRRLTDEGQAIMCTIHQPSALLFESFDDICLLRPGGQVCFFGQIGAKPGQGSERIRTYFEANGAEACPPEENSAEYILEVVSGGKSRGIDWGAKWRESEECKQVAQHVDELVAERSKRPASKDPRALYEYSASPMEQIRQVTLRQFRDVWRDSSFSYGVLWSHLVVGLVSGGFFAKLGRSSSDLQLYVFQGAFLYLLNVPAIVNSIIAKFFELRILFEVRESPSKVYSWYALVASFIISTLPVALVSSVLYALPAFYIPFGAQPAAIAGFWYLCTLTLVCYWFLFSFMLAAACATPSMAANLLPFILPILAIVNGILVPRPQMREPFRSGVFYANPMSYFVQAQVSTVLNNVSVVCDEADLARFNPPDGQTCAAYAGEWAASVGATLVNPDAMDNCGLCQYTTGAQFARTLGADYGFRWQAWGILLGFVVFNGVACFALYWWFRVSGYGLGIDRLTALFSRKQKKAVADEPVD